MFKRLPSLIGLSLLCTGAHADFRIWEGNSGSVIEAELITARDAEVILEKRDKKRISVRGDNLSAKDQEYVLLAFPPELTLEVKVDCQPGFKHQIGELASYRCRGAVKKPGAKAYSGNLEIKLAVVGRTIPPLP